MYSDNNFVNHFCFESRDKPLGHILKERKKERKRFSTGNHTVVYSDMNQHSYDFIIHGPAAPWTPTYLNGEEFGKVAGSLLAARPALKAKGRAASVPSPSKPGGRRDGSGLNVRHPGARFSSSLSSSPSDQEEGAS